MKTYSKRSNAQRAARAALGAGAKEGIDFETSKTGDGGWTFTAIKSKAAGGNSRKGTQNQSARNGRRASKNAALIEMLKRPKGATINEIAKRFSWLPHTTRAAISVQTRKAGLKIESEKVEGRGRVYRIADA